MRMSTPASRRGSDEGMALLFTVSVMLLLTAFLLVSLTMALQQQKPTRRDQDGKAAVAAAQAGLDDYLSRLINNQGYWQTTDATNAALTTSGTTIPGTHTGARFSYQVVRTPNQSGSGGRLVVRAIGTANGVSRALTATFQPGSFLNYVYFSDKENLSPLYTGSTSTTCTKRWWQGRNSGSCSEIQFANGDRINGPMHNSSCCFSNIDKRRTLSTSKERRFSSRPAMPRYSCVRSGLCRALKFFIASMATLTVAIGVFSSCVILPMNSFLISVSRFCASRLR